MTTTRELAAIPTDGRWISAAEFTPSGRELLLAVGGPDVLRWSIDEGRWLEPVRGPDGFTVSLIARAPDGRRLAIGGSRGEDAVVRLHAADTLALVDELVGQGGDFLQVCVFDPVRPTLIASYDQRGSDVWDLSRVPARRSHLRAVFDHVAYTRDARFVVSLGFTGELCAAEAAEVEADAPRDLASGQTLVALHASHRPGEVLAALAGGEVERWDVARGRRLPKLRFQVPPRALSPDGLRSAGTEITRQRCWIADATTGETLTSLPVATRGDHSAEVWSPDGARLLTYGYDTRLHEVLPGPTEPAARRPPAKKRAKKGTGGHKK